MNTYRGTEQALIGAKEDFVSSYLSYVFSY